MNLFIIFLFFLIRMFIFFDYKSKIGLCEEIYKDWRKFIFLNILCGFILYVIFDNILVWFFYLLFGMW